MRQLKTGEIFDQFYSNAVSKDFPDDNHHYFRIVVRCCFLHGVLSYKSVLRTDSTC